MESSASVALVIDTSKFIIANGTSTAHLYAKNKKILNQLTKKLKAFAKDYDVYLAKRIPKCWHYCKKDDRFDRIGDILLVHICHRTLVFQEEKFLMASMALIIPSRKCRLHFMRRDRYLKDIIKLAISPTSIFICS